MGRERNEKKNVDIYMIDWSKKALYGCESILAVLVISKLFYDSYWGMLLLMPVAIAFYCRQIRSEKSRIQWKLNLAFRDALAGTASALAAGYSMENSIAETLEDLCCIYDEKELIVEEYRRMNEEIQLNATVEQVFFRFAERTQVEDIHNFAWILHTAKRTGGDLLKITRDSSDRISERIEVNGEIRTVIAAKRLECNIMSGVPAGIIAYLRFGCPGFLNPLYRNARGILIMTVLLAAYLAAYLAASKIVKIEV